MATPSRTQQRQTSSRTGFKATTKQNPEMIKVSYEHRPFQRMNFYLMGGCIVLIIIGFLLMLGGSSTMEEGFNPDIFSTRRIVVGPTITFLGFLLMAFAIIWQPRNHKKEEACESADTDKQ